METIRTQRLRNLTGILHTEIGHVYEDLERFTGFTFWTYQLPRALDALRPFLERRYVGRESALVPGYRPDSSAWGLQPFVPLSESEREQFVALAESLDKEVN